MHIRKSKNGWFSTKHAFALFGLEDTEYSFSLFYFPYFCSSPSIHGTFQLLIYVSAHKMCL